jgi:hypothetical protein
LLNNLDKKDLLRVLKKEKLKEILNLLTLGVSQDKIAQATELTLSEIEELKKKIH